jgi:diguanylate cyclase (GGDEF)-like protein
MFDNVRRMLAREERAGAASGAAAGVAAQAVPLRRLWWAAVVLLGLSASAVVWTIWQLRADAIGAAISESGNIAEVLANQLSRSLQGIDIALLEIKQSAEDSDIASPQSLDAAFDRSEFHDALVKTRDGLPHVFHLAVADKNGRVIATTVAWPTPDYDVSDRDYFKKARDDRDGQLIASVPTASRINGTLTIVFARDLKDAKGNFAGIVFASVNTKYFQNIYGAIQSVHSLLFTLLNPGGVILFRYPDDQSSTGRVLSNNAVWREARAKGDQGFRVRGQADGNVRYVSIRPVPQYPLIVDVSVTESTSLAVWRQRAASIGVGSAVFLLFSIYLLRAIARQVRLLSESEASLAQKSQQLAHLARHDALTGLANRTLFLEKVAEALARMRRQGDTFAILMLDLDRFKTVNDSLGHPAGDALLKEIARRLQVATREVDCVARFGGDEFAVLQAADPDQRGGAITLSDRILAAVTEPYELDGYKIVLETSIGIALAPQDGDDAAELIKHADLALYRAKAEGRNRYCFFAAAMETVARDRRELEDDMRRAIDSREFELHYQPIVDLVRRHCRGAEALVRWRHPQRGLIPPNQFIPLAEESGLIVPLGEWILRQACADAVKWPSQLTVGVNLSPAQFKHGDLLAMLKATLHDTGLAPHRLVLEITETVLLENNAKNLALLREIRKLGVAIALDDFGTGYSSMTYLQMFPFDRIKIDQSFIQNMTHHEADAAIVVAIVGLGRSLDIPTVGEGVETVEQLVALRAAGCTLAQGYLFGRPLPMAELTFEVPDVLLHDPKAA